MFQLKMITGWMCLATAIWCAGCGQGSSEAQPADPAGGHGHDHSHDDHDHAEHDHSGQMDEDHHDEVDIGSIQLGGMEVRLAQGHGQLEPGKELHLVIRLPESDAGSSVIRAWLGTDDRFSSVVSRADYSASSGTYDVHVVAPDPLPEPTLWWIEITRPDGEKLIGSVAPH